MLKPPDVHRRKYKTTHRTTISPMPNSRSRHSSSFASAFRNPVNARPRKKSAQSRERYNNTLAVLRHVFNVAIDAGIIYANPASKRPPDFARESRALERMSSSRMTCWIRPPVFRHAPEEIRRGAPLRMSNAPSPGFCIFLCRPQMRAHNNGWTYGEPDFERASFPRFS